MNNLFDINYLSVLVSSVVLMALGFLWYSPKLFGKQWMHLSGKHEKDMKKDGMLMTTLTGFIAAWVMSYVLANVIHFADAWSMDLGIKVGVWMWVGFIATTMINSILYEGKPFKLYVINAGYYFVGLALAGAIIGGWN